jgi:hypothetical protein
LAKTPLAFGFLNAEIPQRTAFVATDDMTLRRVAAMHEFHAPSPAVVLG